MLDIACFVCGIIVLVKGFCPLPGNKEVRGIPAYLVGGILVAVLPVVIVVTIVMLFDDMMNGMDLTPEQEIQIMLVDFAIVISMILMAGLVGYMNAQPRQKQRRRRTSADGYDDYEDSEQDEDRRYERYDDGYDDRRGRR